MDEMLTERVDPRYADIDRASVGRAGTAMMNDADATVPAAIRAAMAPIVPAIEAIADRLAAWGPAALRGRRHGWDGSASSTRRSARPPSARHRSQVLGSHRRAARPRSCAAQEGAEDDDAAGRRGHRTYARVEAARRGGGHRGQRSYPVRGRRDASGADPGGAHRGAVVQRRHRAHAARRRSWPSRSRSGRRCSPARPRLKAGTAQKLVLNMISTIAMVRLGKTFGNLMVDLRATNGKLRERAIRIVQAVTGAERDIAAAALEATDWEVKPAVPRRRAGHGRRRGTPPAGPGRAAASRAGGGSMKVLGMISGTSHDGIDVAIVDFESRTVTCCRVPAAPLGQRAVRPGRPGPPRAHAATGRPPLLRTCASWTRTSDRRSLTSRQAPSRRAGPVDLICSHGQTVFHWVDGRACAGHAPAGQPAWIAERTGVAGRRRRARPRHHGRWPWRAARVPHGRAAPG